jgi:hypothetical protein
MWLSSKTLSYESNQPYFFFGELNKNVINLKKNLKFIAQIIIRGVTQRMQIKLCVYVVAGAIFAKIVEFYFRSERLEFSLSVA